MKEKELLRITTKGRFPIPYNTNAGMWMRDREWKKKANLKVYAVEQEKERADVDMLERRKK